MGLHPFIGKAVSTGNIAFRSAGSVFFGAPSLSPTFGTATQSGSLLVCVASTNSTSNTDMSLSGVTGWSQAIQTAIPASADAAIFYKPNCGASETAPRLNSSASRAACRLLEFTGVATSPLDQTANGSSNLVAAVTATAAGADAAPGELVIAASSWINPGNTLGWSRSFNNGPALTDAGNGAVASSAFQFDWGYGISTGNGSADSVTITATPTPTGGGQVLVIASFKHT